MSVAKLQRGGRARYEVRWREGTWHRSKLFDRRTDAQAFDVELRRRRQLGPLAVSQLTRVAPTLDQWIEQRWTTEHGATLEQSTLDCYANVYKCHIAPRLGDLPLGELTVGRLRAWQAERLNAGVSPGTIHKARTFLSSVLRHAAEAEAIAGNPLTVVRAPKNGQRDAVRPLAPATVEKVRVLLLTPPPRHVPASRPGQRLRRAYTAPAREAESCRRDAMIVSVLAYAGLRPGELRALRWADVRERTLLIQRAAAPDGAVKSTKNARARTVRLLRPLAADLLEYRLAAGRPPDDALLVSRADGSAWKKTDWGNWRQDSWAPACREAGLQASTTPYHLRHSFASLLLAEGKQPLYVAKQLGHSLAVLIDTYAHLIDEYEDADRVDPEAEIDRAREIPCTTGVRWASG